VLARVPHPVESGRRIAGQVVTFLRRARRRCSRPSVCGVVT
jgi:hypothetical protein